MDNKTISKNKSLKLGTKLLGNKSFVKEYWKIITPAFLWAITFSLGPIIIYIFIKAMLPESIGADHFSNNIVLAFNYSSFIVFLLQNFIIAIPIAGFPIIGQYISRNEKIKLHQAFRSVLYTSVMVGIVISLLEGFLAPQISHQFIGSSNPRMESGVIFLRIMSISNFFYLIVWLLLSGYSAHKMIWVQVYASITGLIAAIIITPIFFIFVNNRIDLLINDNIQITQSITNNLTYYVIIGLSIISLTWQIIPVIFLVSLTFFQRIWVIKKIKINNKNRLRIRSVINRSSNLMFFKTGFGFNWTMTKMIFRMTWIISIDQSIWAAAHFVLLVYSISYAQHIPALKEQYKMIVSAVTIIGTYVTLFHNGFSIVSIYFISVPLGQNNVALTKQHNKWMISWSFIIGFCVCLLIIIIASFISPMLLSSKDPNAQVQIKVGSQYVTQYVMGGQVYQTLTYAQIWRQAFIVEIIYAFIAMTSAMFAAAYFMLVAGGSKLIILANAIVTIIFAIVVPICSKYVTGVPNGLSPTLYFFINKVEDPSKLGFAIALLLLGENLHTVDKLKPKQTKINLQISGNYYNSI